MPEYRLLTRSTDRKFKRHSGITATDDAQAIELAQAVSSDTDFELWEGRRFVCTLSYARGKDALQLLGPPEAVPSITGVDGGAAGRDAHGARKIYK